MAEGEPGVPGGYPPARGLARPGHWPRAPGVVLASTHEPQGLTGRASPLLHLGKPETEEARWHLDGRLFEPAACARAVSAARSLGTRKQQLLLPTAQPKKKA